jgi:predicted RecB family nuclease
MEWVRLDVSGVRHQGGYVAKQCPVRAQWDELRPAEPLPPSDAARRRMDEGNEFEAEIFDLLSAELADSVVIERRGAADRADREARTLAAMDAGAPVIIGGRLPTDDATRRVGEPDLLVRASGGGYHPVDVKHHSTLTSSEAVPAWITDLTDPWPDARRSVEGQWARKTKNDLFQLAHYRRMLESCGHAADSGWGAIIGSERLVTWYDLDAAIWTTPSLSEGRKLRSTMDVYDFEFAFRLDIIEVARRHRSDPSVELLVVPVRTGECAPCPWWGHCRSLLEQSHDVSLLPFSGWRPWKAHRDRGVATIDDLADLDWRTADLRDRGVDLVDLFSKIDGVDDQTPVADLISPRRHRQVAKLAAAGVHTAGDARELDRRVAAYCGSSLKDLAESIDVARARLAEAPVFLRRGVDRVEIERGDVEIDLDLENSDDGIYLWGALVTDRTGTGLVEEGYRSFVTWDADLLTAEVGVFEELCAWLSDVRSTVASAGYRATVYCYYDKVEAGALRRLAASTSARSDWTEWVDELVGSQKWVDLYRVARDQLVTGAGMGLKDLARIAGFDWEDDDPGGEQSMEWHRIAVEDPDEAVREQSRQRILTYNRNDTEATLALREWLLSVDLPRVEVLMPSRDAPPAQ